MKPRTVAIIQARMGSARLPGKVMLTLGGLSLLTYLKKRIERAETLDSVMVATTTSPRDSILVEECDRHGIPCFRGSEFDVLGRYHAAAAIADAGIIVRVTADNPFTDPESIDRVVRHLLANGSQYVIEMGLPLGTAAEAFTRSALEFVDSVADLERWREHVTLFAKENPAVMGSAFLEPRQGCGRQELRFTVDELKDYFYVRRVRENLPSLDFGLMDLIHVADEMSGCGISRSRLQTPVSGVWSPESEVWSLKGVFI